MNNTFMTPEDKYRPTGLPSTTKADPTKKAKGTVSKRSTMMHNSTENFDGAKSRYGNMAFQYTAGFEGAGLTQMTRLNEKVNKWERAQEILQVNKV